ncbi:urease accessory protein UreD [Acidocella sp.]|uniref:urease accessory protein UreD n=1 Tax=Acidocella sp. TaxID=50710 RepID=UPI0026348386|nr:urease accessory protein UreD [Acidocella sp.]
MNPQLDLHFARDGAGRSLLTRRRAGYPFGLAAPLRGPRGGAVVMLQSISGGLYGGERLGQRLVLAEGADVRLIQPAATPVRRQGEAAAARQSITLETGAGARLIYATRPLILLPGAALIQDWEVVLAPGARLLFWEGFAAHAPGKAAAAWRLAGRVSIRAPGGRLLAAERMTARSGDAACAYGAFGKIWCLGGGPPREPPPVPSAGIYCGVSALPGGAGYVIALAAREGGRLADALESLAGWAEALIPAG